MRGLIIEGATAAGKSTLSNRIQTRMTEEVPEATKIIISEHYTERIFEDRVKDGQYVVPDILNHIQGLCSRIENLQNMQCNGKFHGRGGNSEIFVLLERFLGSHFANLRIYGRHADLLESLINYGRHQATAHSAFFMRPYP